MGWQTFNDRLALFILTIIPALWLSQALAKFSLSEAVDGALIVTWTLVIQYYFRKQPPTGGA